MKVQDLLPQPEQLQELRCFPFLDNDGLIANLQQELPTFLAEANGVQIPAGDQMLWWHAHQEQLPYWSATTKRLALVQPSSAAAERVFSLLRAAFNDKQVDALEDNLAVSVMMAYNYRQD